MERDPSNTSPLTSTHIINTKQTKTNHATTPNGRTSIDRAPMLTRCLPSSQLTAPDYTTPLPYLPITPPPQCIDFDALKASIHASLLQDQHTFQTMLTTTTPIPMTTTTKTTETTDTTTLNDPAGSTATAPTLRQLHSNDLNNDDVADDDANNHIHRDD